jgi:hypothetical protein
MAEPLIPLNVRIALRNAVGGWGPYTVREIDDLFHSYGFSRRDAQVEDAGGARRTEAEAFHAHIDFSSPDQARRYVDLVDEVLERYPEGAAEPDPVGAKLRRELARAGISRGASGHLQLPGTEEAAAAELEAATEGVWAPNRIRVFLSHTSKHRADVGNLKREFDRFAFSCFVAHDAIEPTRQWQEVIELALRSCDVLVAYVTEDFIRSKWTDQEVGWALGREIVVIPIKVGANPYGFFGAYQALTVREGQAPWETAIALTRAVAIAVFRRQRAGAARLMAPMTDAAVDAFCRSSSFEATRRRFELLTLIPLSAWKETHLELLERACTDNSQIREGVLLVPTNRPAPEAVRELIDKVRAEGSRR